MSSELKDPAFHARLAALIGSEKPFVWADRIGISKGAFSRIWNEGTVPGPDHLRRIHEAEGVSLDWLLTGEGPMKRGEGSELPGGFVQVPRYAISAAAGGGALVHSEQIVDHIAFKADWLKQQLGLNPAQAAVISVIGDSMEPCLADGDLILIDTSVTRVENNAIYVIQVEGDLLVKRIQKKIDGTVIIKSDNERYEPEIFRGESVELLKVVGRMVRRLVR